MSHRPARRGRVGWYGLAFLALVASGVVLFYGAIGSSRKLVWTSIALSLAAVALGLSAVFARRI